MSQKKLTDIQRKEIFNNINELSPNQLAQKYGVSRRLIGFIQHPDRYAINKAKARARTAARRRGEIL